MQLHQLKPIHKKKARKRVGRGGKGGTYSGRGMKGQKARAGKKPRADFAGGDTPLTKRLPKQRGQVGKLKKIRKGVKSSRLRSQPVILNLKDIEKKFSAEGGKEKIISPKSLFGKGLVSKIRKSIPKIKIIGQGKIKKEWQFRGVQLSKKLQEEVKKTTKIVKPRTKAKSKTT
jgi:large subunit ribosomal protein L15